MTCFKKTVHKHLVIYTHKGVRAYRNIRDHSVDQELGKFLCKELESKYFRLGGTISATTVQLCCWTEAAVDGMQMNWHGSVPIKPFPKLGGGQDLANGW